MSENKHKLSENTQNLEFAICDFCNSNNYEVLFISEDYLFKTIYGKYFITKCVNCNLVCTNPRLKSSELKKYYSKILEYGYQPEIINLNLKNKFLNKQILTNFFNYPFSHTNKILKCIQFPNYLRIRRKWKKAYFIPSYIKNGKILEIGCSYGQYIYHLKKLGWNVKGVELNEKAVDYAQNVLNLDVFNQDINNFQTNEKFDIIYLRMVLEHIESPKITLRKCFSLLKANGKLILVIPDFSGIEVRIFKKYAYTLHVPYHLYHFTPNSIKKYLKQLSYTKIKIIHDNFDRDLIAPLSFILKEHPNKLIIKYSLKILMNKLIRKSIVRIVITLLSLIGKTSRMIVIAEKKNRDNS